MTKGRRFRIAPGTRVRLKDLDTEGPASVDKNESQEALAKGVEELADLQARLYASRTWSLLVVLQAMDAAGKDSTIRHVMSGLNPQGVTVSSFKAPSDEELDHDFLWRAVQDLPERGRIGVFNRSYYEEVLVVRVHPEILLRQRLPGGPGKLKTLWEERYEDINAFERHMVRSGTVVCKFFLNVSRGEQKKRFLERLDTPRKHWKFSAKDVAERDHWDDYMKAYERMLSATSTEWAPWYVIPADSEWFMRHTVADILIDTLKKLDLEFPEVDDQARREMAAARRKLNGNTGPSKKGRKKSSK